MRTIWNASSITVLITCVTLIVTVSATFFRLEQRTTHIEEQLLELSHADVHTHVTRSTQMLIDHDRRIDDLESTDVETRKEITALRVHLAEIASDTKTIKEMLELLVKRKQ